LEQRRKSAQQVLAVAAAPRALDRKRDEQVGREGVEDRVREPAGGCAHPQRPLARSLDARTHPLVQDFTAERPLRSLAVEPKSMLSAQHGDVSWRLRQQIGDELSIRRRLRLDPESLSKPRRKRVRSQTPLLPFAFPTCSVVQATQYDNGPLGPSFVHELNALEEEEDYDRAAHEERAERDRALSRRRSLRDQQGGGDEPRGHRPEEERRDHGPAECGAEQQSELDVTHPEPSGVRELHDEEESPGAEAREQPFEPVVGVK